MAHRENLMSKRSGAALAVQAAALPDPAASAVAFFEARGAEFGCHANEMVLNHISHDAGAELAYYHYDQVIAGHRVFGGEVVLCVGSLNQVVSAHGHALESDRVPLALAQPKVTVSQAHRIIAAHVNANYEGQFSCAEAGLSTSQEWFRSRILQGGGGAVSLVHHVRGSCALASGAYNINFEAFVDAASGAMAGFVDQTDRLLPRGDPRYKGKGPAGAKLQAAPAAPQPRKALAPADAAGRRLDIAPEYHVFVHDEQLDGEGNPLGCCSGALLFAEDYDVLPSDPEIVDTTMFTIGVARMMRSVTDRPTFAGFRYDLNCSVHYPEFNAYFNGASITVGQGLAVDDVLAHEWGHGYVQYTSGLVYSYQSGALNEAYADVIGETYDLLNMNSVDSVDTMPRTHGLGECSSTPWMYRHNQNPGPDTSYRWLIGEDITQTTNPGGLYAIRDLYAPECFGNPGSTYSQVYHCDATDYGGVHTNSGVPARLYAVLVDGGQFDKEGQLIDIAPIGMTKAFNLFWGANIYMTSTSQFQDFGALLNSTCYAKIGGDLFVPDPDSQAGNGKTVSQDVLSEWDCMQVAAALDGAGIMRTHEQICSGCSGNPAYVGDGYCDSTGENTEACGWDGGDCCPQTCQGLLCGANGWDCLDPDVPPSPTEAPTQPPAGGGSPAPPAYSSPGGDHIFTGPIPSGGHNEYCYDICSSETIVFSSCSSCDSEGDTLFKVVGPGGVVMAQNDDGCPNGDNALLSHVQVTAPAAGSAGGDCVNVCLHTGCFADTTCAAHVEVMRNTHFPVQTPELSDTASATRNTFKACHVGCEGETVTFETCQGRNMDTDMRLFNDMGVELAYDDMSCSSISSLNANITYPLHKPGCHQYCAHVGCYQSATCSAQVNFHAHSTDPTHPLPAFNCDQPQPPPGAESDNLALCGLVHATNIHAVEKSWSCAGRVPSTPPCGDAEHRPWKGIQCNAAGRVKEVSWGFTDFFVQGHIPRSIGYLTRVHHIDFHHQKLRRGIPEELRNLEVLKTLDLSFNMLDGPRPEIVRELKDKGVKVNVANNKFE